MGHYQDKLGYLVGVASFEGFCSLRERQLERERVRDKNVSCLGCRLGNWLWKSNDLCNSTDSIGPGMQSSESRPWIKFKGHVSLNKAL